MDRLFPNVVEDVSAQDAGPLRYVRVAIERGIEAGDGLTYRAPPTVDVGQRVEVPLGRSNKRASGIVVRVGDEELLEGFAAAKVKRILKVGSSRLPAPLVELARWMAEYYICPLGMVLSTMLPAAVKKGVGLASTVEVEVVGFDEAAATIEKTRLTPALKTVWTEVSGLGLAGPLPPRELASRIGARTLGPVNRLLALGLLRPVERSVVRTRSPMWALRPVESHPASPEPTVAQQNIIEGIAASLGSFSVHLLRGVTGSGKTEVYLRVLERAVAAGRTGLVLVPEIALTPQTAGRFIDRFSRAGEVAVLHSGLSAAERHRQWALAASGKAVVAVGARSAVFAPIPRLGLIIVDEEHASDYKQDQLPRYHARDVAIKRGQIEGVPLVLGSATPSLESWANAAAARYRLWELTERVGGGRLPRVEIVDLAAERRVLAQEGAVDPRHLSPIGRRLESALRKTLSGGRQAILLLNRRGYSSYVSCPSSQCGWVMNCQYCDAAMVLHRPPSGSAPEHLRCHHCLAEQQVPRQCPVCGRKTITLGAGTQRLEEDLAGRLGDLVPAGAMVRVDSDTMRTARDYFEVLARFGAGEIRLLLGTQMIAKGLDFPNVSLVGVINADTALSIPDFRAAERTFQLVSQVAGRTGRSAEPGLVIVQTLSPHEPAIRFAAAHDYVSFAGHETEIRARSGLPPARRMARLVVRDPDAQAARLRAEDLGKLLRQSLIPGSRVIGPAPCPVSRIAGQFRFGIELVSATAPDQHAALSRLRAAGVLKSDAHTAVDVDPVATM
jgi:primosomal protein N' (replication factor Y)